MFLPSILTADNWDVNNDCLFLVQNIVSNTTYVTIEIQKAHHRTVAFELESM